MNQPSYSISVPIGFWDQFLASYTLAHRHPAPWISYAFFGGSSTAFILLTWWYGIGIFDWRGSRFSFWAGQLAGYIWVVVFVPGLHLWGVWSYRRNNRSVLRPQTFTFTSEAVEVRGESVEFKLKWDAIFRVVETRRYFFLYYAKRNAYFIPKTAVPSDGEIGRLRSILKAALGPKARLRQ